MMTDWMHAAYAIKDYALDHQLGTCEKKEIQQMMPIPKFLRVG